ncbi:unnamed protein product [Rotaria magnacalcarata]|uniref:NHL repeat-containing protein 2 n=1 Tax=Rotaria magnacalcarata TaxID=392030 RepID=A0A814ZHR4_9BILA|nr:unnamed protein product [Rotaria magnacalcarata]CAF4074533.1 unnamed protein product [Rotaria magnacalcarata]
MKRAKGAKEGIVVAGGQGEGSALTQLSWPKGLFVDTLGTLYVADTWNHRVMGWTQGDKKQGTVVVGGNDGGLHLMTAGAFRSGSVHATSMPENAKMIPAVATTLLEDANMVPRVARNLPEDAKIIHELATSISQVTTKIW